MIDFDPFAISKDHLSHSNDIDLITLESSGRNFCQKCLQQQALEKFRYLNEVLFQQYIRNLLEALDQKSENPNVRSIILPILEVITTNKSIVVKDENHYHEMLRIFNRVIKSYKLEPNELTLVARVFSRISCEKDKPIPLLSYWKIIEQVMLYASNQIDMGKIGDFKNCLPSTCRFFSILMVLILKYIKFFRQYTIDKLSDIIFPLSATDDVILHSRKFYRDSQLACIDFVSNTIVDKCWPYLKNTISGQFSIVEERELAVNIFNTLELCSETSIRYKGNFNDILDKIDLIVVSHKLIYHNSNKYFRDVIRKFLCIYVNHNIEKHFELDHEYHKIIKIDPSIVETYHWNARAYSGEFKQNKIIFYLLLNSVALKTNSQYFNRNEVLDVVQSIKLCSLNILSSTTLVRSIIYLIANLSSSIEDIEVVSVRNYLRTVWTNMQSNRNNNFDNQFLFDDNVFFWAYEYPVYVKMFNSASIKYLLKRSIKEKNMPKILSTLLCHQLYNNIMAKFLKHDDFALEVIKEVIKLDLASNGEVICYHEQLIDRLRAVLPALFHNCLLDSVTHTDEQSRYSKNHLTHRLLEMNILMLKDCNKFKLILDEQFVSDIFKYMENLYKNQSERYSETIILMNELISNLLVTNNPSLLFILKKLDFSILGYALHYSESLSPNSRFVQSIAHLLLKYNELDYPIKCNLTEVLSVKGQNLYKWMMSDSDNLHKLALEVIEKVTKEENSKTVTNCIIGALIHLIKKKPEFGQNKYYCLYKNILKRDEFLYNPMKSRILDKLDVNYETCCPPPPSPISMTDTSRFEDDQIEVSHIINQMEEGSLFETYHQIPDNLFVSEALPKELPPAPDIDSWEAIAHETIGIADSED